MQGVMNYSLRGDLGSFTPTPEEIAIAEQFLAHAKGGEPGTISGEAAVSLFSASGLPITTLSEIWSIADHKKLGVLRMRGTLVAVRLMGWAQRGFSVAETLLLQDGPIPLLSGINALAQSPASPIPPMNMADSIPNMTLEDFSHSMSYFNNANPHSGLITGDSASAILMRSGLPVQTLSQIWTLCDTQTRGQLDCVEFAISMHLIKLVMNGNISTLPSSLEPSLMKHTRELLATHMFSPPRQSFQASSSSSPSSFPPVASPLPHIVTADPYSPQTLYPTPTPSPPLPVASSSTSAITFEDSPWTPSDPGWDWDVSPVLKVEADDLFDALDPGNTGFLADDIAVEFMKNFNMKEDVLSLIWDLADFNKSGKLNRDQFAVLLHLLRRKVQGLSTPDQFIPWQLIPPSMRTNASQLPSDARPSSAPPSASASTSRPTIIDPQIKSKDEAIQKLKAEVAHWQRQFELVSANPTTTTVAPFPVLPPPQRTSNSNTGRRVSFSPTVSVATISPNSTSVRLQRHASSASVSQLQIPTQYPPATLESTSAERARIRELQADVERLKRALDQVQRRRSSTNDEDSAQPPPAYSEL